MTPLLAIMGLALGAGDPPPEDWEVVAPARAGFSVAMPPNSFQKRKATGSEDGPGEVVIVQSEMGPVNDLVAFSDAAPGSARQAKGLLDATRDVMLKSSRARKLSEKPIALGRSQGREVRAGVPPGDDPEGGFLRARIYLSGRRVYQGMAVGEAGHEDDPEVLA